MNRSINNVLLCMALLLAAACVHSVDVQPEPETAAVVKTPVENSRKPAPEKQQPAAEQTEQTVKPASQPRTDTPEEILEKLKAWDKNLLFLKTSFTQVTSFDGVEINRSKGTLFYDKNKHLLRLDTFDNDGKVVQSAVTDKKDLLILDDKGRQVMKADWQAWQQNQPNQALFDFGNYTALLSRHRVQTVRPNYLALTPKEGGKYTLYLTLSPQDAFPTVLKLVSGDVTTQADLTNIQKNQVLPANTFGGLFK